VCYVKRNASIVATIFTGVLGADSAMHVSIKLFILRGKAGLGNARIRNLER
jgi:hypothetical protein